MSLSYMRASVRTPLRCPTFCPQSQTTVDDDSFDFFEQNPAVNTKDVIKVCRKDATKEVTENSSIAAVALENLRDTVEALASPLLDSKGYTISWEEPPAKTEHTKNAKEQKHE